MIFGSTGSLSPLSASGTGYRDALAGHQQFYAAPGAVAGRSQRGVVLPIVMILMVILGVLAVSGMEDTAMQERMSGNLRDREIAFQAAESALREGEAWVQTNRATASANPELAGTAAAQWDPHKDPITGALGHAHRPVFDGRYHHLSADPVYFAGPPQLLRVNPGETPPEFREIFPVIARGQGATDTSVVILRSTFEPL